MLAMDFANSPNVNCSASEVTADGKARMRGQGHQLEASHPSVWARDKRIPRSSRFLGYDTYCTAIEIHGPVLSRLILSYSTLTIDLPHSYETNPALTVLQ